MFLAEGHPIFLSAGLQAETRVALTSQQHLVQQVVYLGQAAELNELELFDHLPGDALQGGQQEQQLSKTTPGVILTVINVVLQTHLDLHKHKAKSPGKWMDYYLSKCLIKCEVKATVVVRGLFFNTV